MIISTITTLLTKLKPYWREVAIVGLVLTVGIMWHSKGTTTPSFSHPDAHTSVVTVSKLTPKVEAQYVADPQALAEIATLTTENNKLKLEVISLTSSVATDKTSGGVGINGGVIITLPSTQMVAQTIPAPQEEFTFHDYQLSATYSAKPSFTYTLSQDFVVTTTTGRAQNGSLTSLVRLAQKVNGTLVEVPTTTVELQAAPNPRKLYVGPSLQAGFTTDKVVLVGLQWLKLGNSKAAEDTSWSFLTPALTLKGGLTILPVSYNLGGVKHSPFSNLWVSPTVGLDKTVGASISVTF